MTETHWDRTFEKLLRANLPHLNPDEPLQRDTQLQEFGLDSFGMMQLIAGLETSYRLTFAPGEIPPAAFATPATLWGTLQMATQTRERESLATARPRPSRSPSLPSLPGQPW